MRLAVYAPSIPPAVKPARRLPWPTECADCRAGAKQRSAHHWVLLTWRAGVLRAGAGCSRLPGACGTQHLAASDRSCGLTKGFRVIKAVQVRAAGSRSRAAARLLACLCLPGAGPQKLGTDSTSGELTYRKTSFQQATVSIVPDPAPARPAVDHKPTSRAREPRGPAYVTSSTSLG